MKAGAFPEFPQITVFSLFSAKSLFFGFTEGLWKLLSFETAISSKNSGDFPMFYKIFLFLISSSIERTSSRPVCSIFLNY